MRKLFYLLFIPLSFSASAQDVDMDIFRGMNMRHIGPATMSGRVTSIDVVHDNTNVMYVGTASGGLWKTENGGMEWNPVFDDQPLQSVGAVAIDQNNPSVVWAGSGEGNPRNSQTSGAGIFKSLDAGKTWKMVGLDGTKTIHRIIPHRDDPNTVHVASLGSAWGPNKQRGVFRTKDGGKTWKKVLYVNDSTGCADLVVDPSNPNKMIAAMWHYGRKPYFFESGGSGSGLYVTHDGGDTWKKRTELNGLPKGNLGRIGLAISESDPRVVYALIESSEIALYKSTDGGLNWSKVSTDEDVGNRPFYYADIYVNPGNPNEVWSLWSMVSKSIDGGKTFDVVIPYSGVHPDHHAFWIHPDDPSLMLDGNDGGLNISRDGGETWQFFANLPLGQYYHINYDMDIPYHVYGGMQDNGSWQGPAYVWHSGGIRNDDWKEISFGDGFDVVPFKGESRYAFSMWQEGNLMETDIHTGESRYIQPVHPDSIRLRYNWNAAIAQDPFSDCGLFFGSQYVHYTTDCGKSWEILSPDLTTNDTLKQKQADSGGLTYDVTGAENYTSILCISPSPLNRDVIWVGTDDGNVQVTRNGGDVWSNCIAKMKGLPDNAWIPQIEVSQHNEGEAFVIANNYRQNDWLPYVYHTTNYGAKWTRLVDEGDVSGHALSIVQDPKVPSLLFLGTENGLYISFDYGESWKKWKHDYPSVSTMDLKIHPREDDLIIGTFGRAGYILDDIGPLRAAARGEARDTLEILSAPEAYLSSYQRADGIRFPGDAHWEGENRWSGARISYFIRNDVKKKDKPEKDKKNKIEVMVIDQAGDTLRTFTTTADSTGVHVLRWGLDTKGVRTPSRSERKKDADEPGRGPRVKPGNYWVHLSWKGHHDSIEVQVNNDPRLEFDEEVHEVKLEMWQRWADMAEKADKGFEQTKKAIKTIGLVKSQLTNVEDSLKKEVIEFADSLNKELKAIQKMYMLPKGTKGYRDESQLLTSILWGSRSYINSGSQKPGENAEIAISKAEAKIDEVVQQINDLMSGAWVEWQALVEEFEYSLFEEFEKIE